jgi:hypothetical protein
MRSGHPRPVHPPSFYFLMGAILAPHTREQTMARLNPGAERLRKTHGVGAAAPQFGSMAGDAMKREGNKAAGGRVAAAHLVVCVCVCVWCEFFFVCVSLIVE